MKGNITSWALFLSHLSALTPWVQLVLVEEGTRTKLLSHPKFNQGIAVPLMSLLARRVVAGSEGNDVSSDMFDIIKTTQLAY